MGENVYKGVNRSRLSTLLFHYDSKILTTVERGRGGSRQLSNGSGAQQRKHVAKCKILRFQGGEKEAQNIYQKEKYIFKNRNALGLDMARVQFFEFYNRADTGDLFGC